MMNANKLGGKVALITGATSGLGLATAKLFVAEGAYVFITGRRQKELEEAVRKVGRNVTGIQGDVANLADLDRLYGQVRKEKEHIDILVANAGGGAFAPLGAITEEHFDKTFDGNVRGTLFTVQKALPLMKDGGSIILTASSAASKGTEAFSVYAASKAAIRSFARGWTTDLKARKIRVNAISPGVVPTEGYNTSLGMSAEQVVQFSQQMSASIPLGRVGTPDEVAKAMVFLASDDSSYITGIELAVDGATGTREGHSRWRKNEAQKKKEQQLRGAVGARSRI
jgi:NAD(P)-dependent dehydrogenase (short-subunit alcohol dehydrogenase family)